MKKFFSISDFAKLADVSRQTLIYYDKIGLFYPSYIAPNGYRCYTHNQIGIITLINTLTELGVPLKEIKQIINQITPEKAINLFEQQRSIVQDKIKRLTYLQDMIETRIAQGKCGIGSYNECSRFAIQEILEDIPLYMGERIDCPKNQITDDMMVAFFNGCTKKGIPFGYATGYLIEQFNMAEKRPEKIAGLCFRMKNKDLANTIIPAGKYVIGYVHGDYGKTDSVYDSLTDFLQANGLKIAGNIYEEYLLDEVTNLHPNDYLLQVTVKVN